MHTTRVNCLIEGEDIVFTVTAAGDDNVSIFKESIHSRRARDSLKDVDPHTLVLWKLKDSNPIAAEPADSLVQRIGDLGPDFSKFADRLDPTEELSSIFPTQPLRDHLHIIVCLSILTPSPFQGSNVSKDLPPNWLAEIHKKLWNKRHLFGEIFRTANLTTADFIQLQRELDRINPSRTESSYEAQDVLTVKADFLREKSCSATLEFNNAPNCIVPSVSLVAPSTLSTLSCAMDLDATAYHGDCPDTAKPSVISNISVPLTLSASRAHPVLDDTTHVDADADPHPAPPPGNCPGYIVADAEELSMGSTAILPCIIRYMDLTTIGLKESIPVKHLTLIRDEWHTMIDVFNGRKRGVRGSAIFTGSSGIGNTCFLYYILILCLIKGQPVVFQDKWGDVYLIADEVQCQRKQITVAGDDVLTLIDADDQICLPDKDIFRSDNLRILLASSPMSRKERRWLKYAVDDQWAAYVMMPWSRNEWLVTSLFIVGKDITLDRFWKTYKICGSLPYQFLYAAKSREARKRVQMDILYTIQSKDIGNAIHGVVRDEVVPHPAFVVYPREERFLFGCYVKAISKGAMETIFKTLDIRSADAAFELYKATQGSDHAEAFRSNMWELKAHEYLPRRGGCSFTIRSLDDAPNAQLDLPVGIEHFVFGPPQKLRELSGTITDCVDARKAGYLQPISDNFASLDSIIYQPNNSLIGIQITNAKSHSIDTKGLNALQSHLSSKNKSLSTLRPTFEKPWIILFVVPSEMEKRFTKQNIVGEASATWSKKTVQYVLGLDEREVFRGQFEDEDWDNQFEDEESDNDRE